MSGTDKPTETADNITKSLKAALFHSCDWITIQQASELASSLREFLFHEGFTRRKRRMSPMTDRSETADPRIFYEEIERLRSALRKVRSSICATAEDTVWLEGPCPETVVDFITYTLGDTFDA